MARYRAWVEVLHEGGYRFHVEPGTCENIGDIEAGGKSAEGAVNSLKFKLFTTHRHIHEYLFCRTVSRFDLIDS